MGLLPEPIRAKVEVTPRSAAEVAFLLNGGENLGKKSVKSDADLPPVTSGQR